MSGIVGGNLGRGSGLIKAGAIDDNSVTLAKMAGLARGKLIYGDASGDPAALDVGGADEVLTHDGTDFDWAAVAGGVDDGGVTMAKLSTSATDTINVENRVCKVWVQFNGTGTVAIQSSFNVGSITDYDTGQYGVNFSTGLGDDDFAAVTGGVKGGYGAGNRINDLSSSLCKIDNWSTSSYTDSAIITLVLMGNSA